MHSVSSPFPDSASTAQIVLIRWWSDEEGLNGDAKSQLLLLDFSKSAVQLSRMEAGSLESQSLPNNVSTPKGYVFAVEYANPARRGNTRLVLRQRKTFEDRERAFFTTCMRVYW